jgi:hypothetical protein
MSGLHHKILSSCFCFLNYRISMLGGSDLVGVQVVIWDGGGTDPAGEYTLFYRKRTENHELGTGSFHA